MLDIIKTMNLVIVESPTKAKTISKFLGKDYDVESSYGHIRDLPKSKLAIDIEKNFEPQYIIPKKAQKNVTKLKKLAAKADKIILATDEDREGEAISWHLTQVLKLENNTERIVFHEITKNAILNALNNPRTIDMDLVNAQQARRILDRLVGYKLSPFLWKKVARGLSAGRVQSVALKLIVERENEIRNFKQEEYFNFNIKLRGNNKEFEARLVKIDNNTFDQYQLKSKAEAENIKTDLEKSQYRVEKVEQKETFKYPLPPFITSNLQREAVKRLGFSPKKTMFLAQNLYENGFITYMRTDSFNISQDAAKAAREWLINNLGKQYSLEHPRIFKKKSKLSQEAHEAIRPTNPNNDPEKIKLDKDQKKLYELIWKRFIASQMPDAVFESTKIEINAKGEKTYLLSSSGNVMKFDGFLKIWPSEIENIQLPLLKKNDQIELMTIELEKHLTQLPARYNEASLIKTLEKYGVGRPSTYAPILSVLEERNYVKKERHIFIPTEIGEITNKVLSENFPEIVDINFTAKVESDLDKIAEHKKDWHKVVKDFYYPFAKQLEEKYKTVQDKTAYQEKTDLICEICGSPMVIKLGKFGKFLACSNFPKCKNKKSLNTENETNKKEKNELETINQKEQPICDKCGAKMVLRKSRFGLFWGCSNYPKCKNIKKFAESPKTNNNLDEPIIENKQDEEDLN